MRNSLYLLGLGFILLWTACSEPHRNEAFNRIVHKKPYTVVMFFAPDCPLCITFSKPFNVLQEQFPDVQFMAVQSGMHYEPMEIKMYKEETDLKAKIFIDRDFAVAKQLGASVTPEFFVLNQEEEVLYHGLLDDRMKSLGVYKQHWDEFYLLDALHAVVQQEEIQLKETKAIGCVLEY